MKEPSIDELVQLPESAALLRHFDAKNLNRFRLLLALVSIMSVAGLGLAIGGRVSTLRVVFYCVNLLLMLGFVATYREQFFERHFRHLLIAYLLLQMAFPGVWIFQLEEGGRAELWALFPFMLLLFRLRVLEYVVLDGALWTAEVLRLDWTRPAGAKPPIEEGFAIGITVVIVLCLGGALVLTQLDKRRFLEAWRREYSRSRERLRMREEIDYARKIQLSMLPPGAPDLGWLEFSAASLPATEVGGDYYDYFRLAPSRLAVVIGDVAGHGLASGLLLSGVRSCLYLLEDELAAPVAVFARLNRMVRRTTDRRTYITLLCAVIDREAGMLTLSNAGHPPLLHHSAATGRCDEVGKGAPPLGGFLDARYEQEERPVGAGDLLVLYTDGLIEACNSQGLAYGDERLRRAVQRAADGRPAREVRDNILSDLANFRGNAEQDDDITLVIARLR
ncbi:MAG TPA: PP2C family protein-serine/threonine phosphatase [Thermoanaerobaculia bacterium]|nr:PP2C family protein-serine/threonine phosphatase [Thermoanaerobaculia bacterium]